MFSYEDEKGADKTDNPLAGWIVCFICTGVYFFYLIYRVKSDYHFGFCFIAGLPLISTSGIGQR